MKDKSRKLTVINTGENPASIESAHHDWNPRSTSQSYPNTNFTRFDVWSKIVPVIAENYADVINELDSSNLLTNPSFSNNGEGWTRSESDIIEEKAIIQPYDNKNRMHLSDNGSVSQKNILIRKPSEHSEFIYNEQKDDETPVEENSDISILSDDIVLGPVEWETIEEPVLTKGSENVGNVVYLNLSYICLEEGILNVGIKGSNELTDESLKTQIINVTPSENVQTISTQGTWDGNGDFTISLNGGYVVLIDVSLTEKPLEEFIKQVNSHFKQLEENIIILFDSIKEVLKQVILIQTNINKLYNNDSLLNSRIDDLVDTVDLVLTRIIENSISISSLEQNISSIQSSISSLSSSVSSLSSRVSALESKE